MADAGITLNTLFGLPDEGFCRHALSIGIEAEEMSSMKSKALAAIKGLQWSTVEGDIFHGISELLNMDLMDVMVKTWNQYGTLADYAELSKAGGTAQLVELTDHSMSMELHPFVEIQFAEFTKKIFFDVTLEITLKAIRLKIEEARIKSVETGSCEGKGEIKIRDITLLQLPFKPIDLPGKINLGEGIAIA
jgi:hypothetical protein